MRLFAFSQAVLMSVCVLLFWLIVAHVSFPLARPCSTGHAQTHVAAPFFLPARARFFFFSDLESDFLRNLEFTVSQE
jgi:hypothetical protein